MRRNGRLADLVFEPAEKLFRRYRREHFIGGRFSNMGLSFAEPPSVNREKYSEPSDVVFSEADEWADWGVLSFQVQHLPHNFPADRPEYTFRPNHDPLENNYSHSLIHCDSIPPSGRHVEPRKGVRKLVRAVLSQRISVEIEAQL
jgi:hypothetical protein